jgi:hypothetical protein
MLFASTATFAQPIEERVRDLERRVEQLERQSNKQPPSAGSHSQIDSAQEGWKRRENWRSLRRGMTELDAKGLLGEPHKIDAYSTWAVWYYNPPFGGNVRFGRDGRVDSWSEPTR